MRKSKLGFRVTLALLMVTVMVMISACGNSGESNGGTSGGTEEGKVTLRFFSNLPDRKSGQGLAEQTVIDQYMKENPNIKVEVEALAEEPFKNKLKAYMASNEPVDITMVHYGAELSTLVSAGWVEELQPSDYEGVDYNFLPGAMGGFTFDNKLYGLPRNSDYAVIYYNRALFDQNGLKVPSTLDELLAVSKKFREADIEPISMNGKDLWNLAVMYQNIAERISGDQTSILEVVAGKKKFADDPSFLEAAKVLKQFVDEKVLNTAFLTMDYGASQNLFTQGKAAMWYMGSWEAGMASNEQLSPEFRQNLGVLKFPVVTGGKGKDTDLISWNGGGYSLVKASQHKEEAKKLFDYLMKADKWAKVAWDTGAAVPAQQYELTGKETNVQKELTDILLYATSSPGMTFNDAGTPALKDAVQTTVGKLVANSITPEQFIQELQSVVDKNK